MDAASGASTTGQMLQIWQYKGNNVFELDEDALERILLDSRVQNSKVMVVSVGGWSWTGNSFLLNVFLKYLQNPGKPDWMVNPIVPMKGFTWKGNPYKMYSTNGVCMWSEPFFITTPSGEEICVLLMDTQGSTLSSEETSPMQDKLQLFKSLISSVQLFSTYFVHYSESRFKYVVECGKLASEVFKRKPYQTLYFLIRDWGRYNYLYPSGNYPLGFEGAENMMKTELQKIKLPISECFEDLRCYTMPFPGGHIFTKTFQGCLSDKEIKPEFLNSLKVLTEHLFHPKNVVIKEINGKQVTGLELFQYFKFYSKALHRHCPQLGAWQEAALELVRMIQRGQFKGVPYSERDAFSEKVMARIDTIKCKRILNPNPCTLVKALEEPRDTIAEIEDIYFSKLLGSTETMNGKAWDVIAVDKAELFYARKMDEFMYGKHMDLLNGLIMKIYHDVCCRSAVVKLRRMGVGNKIFQDELKGRLEKLYVKYVKEFERLKSDLNLGPLSHGKIDVSRNKMNYGAVFQSVLVAIQPMNAKAAVSKDKKSN